jgi:hypothetical protein
MKFIKYRHTFSYGHGNDWEIEPLYHAEDFDVFEECVQDFVESLEAEYGYSDKYRGLEYEILDNPGNEWLKEKISDNGREILWLDKMNNIFRDMIK